MSTTEATTRYHRVDTPATNSIERRGFLARAAALIGVGPRRPELAAHDARLLDLADRLMAAERVLEANWLRNDVNELEAWRVADELREECRDARDLIADHVLARGRAPAAAHDDVFSAYRPVRTLRVGSTVFALTPNNNDSLGLDWTDETILARCSLLVIEL